MITARPDLIGTIYDNYLTQVATPGLRVLRDMVKELMLAIPTCRIVIDGLDECDEKEQTLILEDVSTLVTGKNTSSTTCCKMLVFSRDTPIISKKLRKILKRPTEIPLSNETQSINKSIRVFVNTRLSEIEHDISMLRISKEEMDDMGRILMERAEGMFLWVTLVLHSLSNVDSIAELRQAIATLPKELPLLYSRIIGQICSIGDDAHRDKVVRMLTWLTFGFRPLRSHELLHGVAITADSPTLNKATILQTRAVEICKPLIEQMPNGTISLVHFTLKEYVACRRILRETVLTVCFRHLIANLPSYSLGRSLNCHEELAGICARIVYSGLWLLDPHVRHEERQLAVATGLHSLLPYAIDFFLDHLIKAAIEEQIQKASSTNKALVVLEHKHRNLQEQLRQNEAETTHEDQSSDQEDALPDKIRAHAIAIRGLPVYRLGLDLLSSRHTHDNIQTMTGRGA